MSDKKTWAIILGTAAGVGVATAAITWYMHAHGSPGLQSVQDKIQWAHERLKELEQVADSIKNPDEPAA